ncbi:BrnA antitoxin family protein [Marivita sp. S6314]|uniref:BrnA antitoxin family protein n=1 Tax=Marivita sp. S6314 TaxID=2926406 RepID=UPI001FF2B66A|nr:BrnA antitoxin family protein [Marivita sp. S6314]MCK0151222.1 BrnA antitoxin family protein [Marivita sp. S6314]
MKENNITRITLEDARKMKGQTDWDRLRREDEQGIEPAYDPEFDDVEWDWDSAVTFQAGEFSLDKLPRSKAAISLRVDRDVLAFFKEGGKGYQTRMNAVLRAYMNAQIKD